MYDNTHFNNNCKSFKFFNQNCLSMNMEDLGNRFGFSLKNVYDQLKNNSEEHQDSHTVVNELKETSPGVWECEVQIHLKNEDTTKLKSIYKGPNNVPNLDYRTYYGGQTQDSTDGSDLENVNNNENNNNNKMNNVNLLCGNFIPVYGPRGCNFPPDYRLVQSRLGPQYKCFFPSQIQKPYPQYINNQFLKSTGLARWDSITKDNVDNWDPFNLKPKNLSFPTSQNNNFQPNQNLNWLPNQNVNWQFNQNPNWLPNKNLHGLKREILVYPNTNFTNNFKNY